MKIRDRSGLHKRAKEAGKRGVAGEDHPRAVLTDHEVELVHSLLNEGFSYSWVAAKMEVSKSCIQHIATGYRRGSWVRILATSTKR